MGRKGVPFEEVAKIADEMFAAGTEPGTTEVRKRLGGVGSNSTIGAHLAKVRAKRAAAAAPDVQTTLPNEIAKAITTFINGQVDAVRMAATKDLAAERTAAEVADAEVDQLAEAFEAAQARIAELEVEVAEVGGRLKQGLTQANDAYAALESKLIAAERRTANAEKATAVAETLVAAAERRAVEATNREQEMRAELKGIPKRAN